MKKFIILLFLLAIIGIGFIPVVTTRMAENAFARPNDASAQESLNNAIIWKMRLYMYEQARKMAEKAIIWFPESPNIDSYLYCAALSAEHENVTDVAIHWYSRFLEIFPNHPWSSIVKAKLDKLSNSKNAK